LRDAQSEYVEATISLESPDDISRFEKVWHPSYQRISEHVFNHLINIPLFILGRKHRKDYLSLSLSNRTKTLLELFSSKSCVGYDSVVRNAISHGGLNFSLVRLYTQINVILLNFYPLSLPRFSTR